MNATHVLILPGYKNWQAEFRPVNDRMMVTTREGQRVCRTRLLTVEQARRAWQGFRARGFKVF